MQPLLKRRNNVHNQALAEAAPVVEPNKNTNSFFDKPAPDLPEQLFGIDTQAVLRLGRAVTALDVLPLSVRVPLYKLPDGARLLPLIEELQSSEELSPEQIRPYRKTIKHLNYDLEAVDKLAAAAAGIGVGIPARRALNKRIERDFASHATQAIERARNAVEHAQADVEFLASFENPQQQFVSEVSSVTDKIVADLEKQQTTTPLHATYESGTPAPRGLAGFIVQIIRRITGLFRRRMDSQKVQHELTAHDVGTIVAQNVTALLEDRAGNSRRLPILSKFVLEKLPDNCTPTPDQLAFIAPEILQFLFSLSPNNQKQAVLQANIARNPHNLRFVTRFKRRHGRFSLDRLQYASKNILPSIRDVLPTHGTQVLDSFEQLRRLLEPSRNK